jgi:3-deoxy-D-manno-octulosonic-acid transferase
MNRTLYSFLWWLALPLVLARLWWRGRKEPGYRAGIKERLGFYGPRPPEKRTFMVHAVSVGETRAAEPLVEALLAGWPDSRVLLTHMTPTGRATGRALFAPHGERVIQSYLPYDTGFMVRRFLRHFAPRICILMETEVWPNLIAGCAQQSVPVALVNARLSERSLRRGQRFGGLMAEAARAITSSPRRPRRTPRASARSARRRWRSPAASSSTSCRRRPRSIRAHRCARVSLIARCCCAPARAKERRR